MRATLLAVLTPLLACWLSPRSSPAQSTGGPVPPGADLKGLPITEVPGAGGDSSTLALLMTGDGGWAALPANLSGYLAAHGVAVVGINMRAYLFRERTPDEVAGDMTRVLDHYLEQWHRARIVVIGYSRGADIAPFVVNRLPAGLKARVTLIVMLGIARNANFEFHLIDLIRDVARASDRPTAPELERLRGTPMVCFYGTEEHDSACRSADSTLMIRIPRAGGHQVQGEFDAIGASIVRAIPR